MEAQEHTVVAPATEEHPRNTEATVLPLGGGKLLLAWSRFCGASRDDSKAEIAAVVSADGGRSWGQPFVLQGNTGSMNVMSPSLRRLADGSIGFVFLQKDGHDSCTAYFRRSTDEGQQWSDPVRVTVFDGYSVVVNDSLQQLPDGRLIVPVQNGPECWSDREHYVSLACYSDDNGRTWHRSANEVDLPERGAMEPCIVALTDGSLLMNLRTQLGSMYYARSTDRGETWSAPYDSRVASPESPAHLTCTGRGGELMLLWNSVYVRGADHGGPRRPLVAALSSDGGTSWHSRTVLEDDPASTSAYPSAAFDSSDVIVTYYRTQYQMGLGTDTVPELSLVLRRFSLEALG